MAKATAVWHGERLRVKIEGHFKTQLLKAAEMLRSQTVRNLSIGRTRIEGPSEPGEFPHVDTGDLRKSVKAQRLSNDHAVVFFTVSYGLFHEIGDRPFLKRTFDEIKHKLAKVLMAKPKSLK